MQIEMSVVGKALYPVFVVASIFGVQVFEYYILPLNFVHYGLMWTIYFVAFVALNIWTEFSTIFHPEYQYEVSYNVLASFISTGLTLRHRKKFDNCLESLEIINTSLGQFDIPDEYDKLHMWTWKVVGIWIFMVGFFILIDIKWMYLLLGKFAGTMGSFWVNYPCCINLLNYIIICLLLWHLHGNLCKVSREINTIFGLQMALEIGTYFVYVSSLTISTCLNGLPTLSRMKSTGRGKSNILVSLIMGWIKGGFYVVRLVYINHMCESVSTKANSTRMILHNFLSCVNAAEFREEILQFILHMVNRPLKFHAAGMFHYGYSFIYTIVGALTTLLVIILQSSLVADEIFGFIMSQYMENGTLRIN